MLTRSSSPSYDLRTSASGENQMKRKRGAMRLNCAECRRLKLRCDRAVPCSSCVKRGCGAICPDGSLTTGQGNRFVLATTEELHEKNQQLAYRIRDLEDALQSLYSDVSTEPHPLLSEELLKIKTPLQREPLPLQSINALILNDEIPSLDVATSSGSMAVQTPEKSRYYGHTANSWYFLQNGLEGDAEALDETLNNLQTLLPSDILARASMMPISSLATADKAGFQSLLWYLPSSTISYELRTVYYTHAAWMYNPISVEFFDTQVYPAFYGSSAGVNLQLADKSLPHKLSLMFMVLAIGSLMDSTLPAYNMEAEKYHQLARAALFQTSLLDLPTHYAVQALFLMSYYLFLADRHGTTTEARWVIMGIAVKIGQGIGLHRDSAHWKFDSAETQHRRELFWELFTYDSWQCLTFGRPPSFSLPHIDCRPPFFDDSGDDQIFHTWKHRFTSECMSLLHDQAFGTRMPSYATVLQLDKKIHSFPVPSVLRVAGLGGTDSPLPTGYSTTAALTLQRHIVLAIRETNRLYLHRSFFAKAISDYPGDPLQSPYRESVLAAYHCAQTLVALMRSLHAQLETLCERMWFLWTHIFSCSVVLGSIVTRCPSMSLAPAALVQLDSACELFSRAASGFRATNVLEVMLHLQRKARHSLSEYQRGGAQGSTSYSQLIVVGDNDEELTMLRGNAQVGGADLTSQHRSGPSVSISLPPSPQGQWGNTGTNAVERRPSFDRRSTASDPSFSESWSSSQYARVDGEAEFMTAPYYGYTAGRETTYQTDVPSAAQSQLQQSHDMDYTADFSSGTGGHGDYGAVPQQTGSSFLEHSQVFGYGDGSTNTHYFPMDTMLAMAGPSSEESRAFEPSVYSAWEDLVTGLQLP